MFSMTIFSSYRFFKASTLNYLPEKRPVLSVFNNVCYTCRIEVILQIQRWRVTPPEVILQIQRWRVTPPEVILQIQRWRITPPPPETLSLDVTSHFDTYINPVSVDVTSDHLTFSNKAGNGQLSQPKTKIY